ncbi:host-nuclease inhibitor Gam family protein [Dysgonomonas sp. GY617]|uniref:host-nuclease inhibitor Gam family protein n=1 Tax=Dysgonomonas sp. GY617 TaxID=2780420 RepID=UPI0018836F2E|nr:host-nuclease inhibitor Gam family protein [Dysgonomonas sp. GY617]MBF0576624.1 host-nuclease inhibitor Gam family protein [Dysgonomonas sp. GY617]
MAKREKKTVLTNISDAQMNEALTVYAKADAQIVKITADLDLAFTKLRDAKADELAKLDAQKSEAFDLVQAYAMENKENQFSKKKSLELTHGVIGFRIGTPKLKNKKGFTWAAVTNLLKEFLPAYVRTVDEPAKDKLLADRNDEAVAPLLKKVGVEVVQDEAFYIELKKETNE